MRLTAEQRKDGMMRLFLISAFSVLFLFGCASTLSIKKDIQRIENRTVNNEARIARLEKEVVEVKKDSYTALSLANQVLWKDKVIVTEFIPYLAEREIFFAFDSFELSPAAKILLDSIVVLLDDDLSLKLTMSGHADEIGSNVYNFDLGKRRAESIKRYLNKRGIELYQMFSISFGESAPKTSNATEAGRAENRRVAVQLWAPM